MRTDAIITKEAVYCPQASTIGIYSRTAHPGDLVTYAEYDGRVGTGMGFMLGSVSAPPLGPTRRIEGYLLLLTLNDDLDHAFERWVDPDDVVTVLPAPRAGLVRLLCDARFYTLPIDRLRYLANGGYLTPGGISHIDELPAGMQEYHEDLPMQDDVDRRRAVID